MTYKSGTLGHRTFVLVPQVIEKIFAKGELLSRKTDSQASAAFRACKMLYEKGRFDEHFFPKYLQHDKETNDDYDPKYLEQLKKIRSRKEIDQTTQKTVFKKFYPPCSFDPFKHPFKCDPESRMITCHLYALHFSKTWDGTPQGERSLGFVYWNDHLDGMQMAISLDENSKDEQVSFEYIGEAPITLGQYEKFVRIDRFLTASVRSWDVNFFEMLFKNTPVAEKSALSKKKKHMDLLSLPPIESLVDVKYSFFVVINKEKEIDLEFAAQALEHLKRMTEYFLYFRDPMAPEYCKGDSDDEYEKLQVDEDFISAFRQNPTSFKGTVVQNLTDFNKFIISDIKPILEVDLQHVKVRNRSLQTRAMYFLERHFDYQITKEDFVLHVKSFGKMTRKIIKGGKLGSKDRRQDKHHQRNYGFVSEFRPYPIDTALSLMLHQTEKIIGEIADNEKVIHFKEKWLRELEEKALKRKSESMPALKVETHNMIGYAEDWKDRLANRSALFLNQSKTLDLTNNDESKLGEQQKGGRPDKNMTIGGFSKIDEVANESSFKEDIIAQDLLNPKQLFTPNIKWNVLKTSLSTTGYDLTKNYENYEFLGDTILKLLSTIEVYVKYQREFEGFLSIERSKIVRNSFLEKKAVKWGIFEYILLKKETYRHEALSYEFKTLASEEEQQKSDFIPDRYQHIPEKTLADVLEALTAVYYLENGNALEASQRFLYMLEVLSFPTFKPTFLMNDSSFFLNYNPFEKLEKDLNYRFKNRSLLFQAFTHPSMRKEYMKILCQKQNLDKAATEVYTSESKIIEKKADVTEDAFETLEKQRLDINAGNLTCFTYDRLEFLGDAVFDYVVVSSFYEEGASKKLDPYTLTIMKHSVVSNHSLALISLENGLDEYLICDVEGIEKFAQELRAQIKSKRENLRQFQREGDTNIKILADIFEALVGAIFIDTGFDYSKTKEIVLKMAHGIIQEFSDQEYLDSLPMNKVKKYCHENKLKPPTIRRIDDPTKRMLKYELVIEDEVYASTYASGNKFVEEKLYKTAAIKLNLYHRGN